MSVCSPGEQENAVKVGFTAACFSRHPFQKRWLRQQWTLAPSSLSPSRVLSMRETFPLDAVLAGRFLLRRGPCFYLGFLLGRLGFLQRHHVNRSCFFGVLNTRGSMSPSSPPGEGDRPRVALRKDRRVGVVGNNNLGGRAKSGEKSGCSGGSLLCSEGL
jgi:hypothetical protein